MLYVIYFYNISSKKKNSDLYLLNMINRQKMRTKFNIPNMYFILLQYNAKNFVDLCIFIINIKYKKFYQYL